MNGNNGSPGCRNAGTARPFIRIHVWAENCMPPKWPFPVFAVHGPSCAWTQRACASHEAGGPAEWALLEAAKAIPATNARIRKRIRRL
jgi:hypothetical protein